jgi:hypothetical protein
MTWWEIGVLAGLAVIGVTIGSVASAIGSLREAVAGLAEELHEVRQRLPRLPREVGEESDLSALGGVDDPEGQPLFYRGVCVRLYGIERQLDAIRAAGGPHRP